MTHSSGNFYLTALRIAGMLLEGGQAVCQETMFKYFTQFDADGDAIGHFVHTLGTRACMSVIEY
jgi:hypothetical protein